MESRKLFRWQRVEYLKKLITVVTVVNYFAMEGAYEELLYPISTVARFHDGALRSRGQYICQPLNETRDVQRKSEQRYW